MPSDFERNVLIAGGAGFIGSHFLLDLIPRYSHWRFVNVDKLTYASNLNYLKNLELFPNYVFTQGDIIDKPFIESLFVKYNIDSVINFAAESHVDNSLINPEKFVQTNFHGTFTLLEVARKFWIYSYHCLQNHFALARFYQISTDEVYGSLGMEGCFTEKSPFLPNSPYSATKAAADLLVRAYGKTYGLPILISHCSNNYGPHQHEEKFIPKIIQRALNQESIPIYGTGLHMRDWLYVGDHVRAIELIFRESRIGKVYNIGANQEIKNIDLAYQVCKELDMVKPLNIGSYQQFLTFIEDRPGHDLRYSVNYQQLNQDLGWNPQENLKTGLKKTIFWYLRKNDKKL